MEIASRLSTVSNDSSICVLALPTHEDEPALLSNALSGTVDRNNIGLQNPALLAEPVAGKGPGHCGRLQGNPQAHVKQPIDATP